MSGEHLYLSPGLSVQTVQSVIDSAPAGSTIHLAAGSYVFSETLVINRSDISLVGAGSEQTKIIANPALGDAPVIQLGHPLFKEVTDVTYDLAEPAPKGATSITLPAGHDVAAGDYLYLSQDNTAALFAEIGDTQWQKDVDLRTFLVEVRGVSGEAVSLAAPLPFDFAPGLTDVEHRPVIEGNLLAGFTVQGGWGASDPSAFSNEAPEASGSTMILVAGTAQATLSDITVREAGSHGITIANSTGLEMESVTVDGAVNKGSGGEGYGIWIRDVFDSSFTDLTVLDTRHAVLFASYTSATGNTVEVTHTNRDINLHGGLDQDNSVLVKSSVRQGEETGYLAPVVFINEGESYGAPTDPEANTVEFQTVRGTVRAETVHADDSGVSFVLHGGPDTAVTGAGDDYVDLGTGHDTYIASAGEDTAVGGGGVDTAVFALSLNSYATEYIGDVLVVSNTAGTTWLTDFETVIFGDTSFDADAVPQTQAVTLSQWEEQGDQGYTFRNGGAGWERMDAWTSTLMGGKLNALDLKGKSPLNAVGNALDNHVLGNEAGNWIEGGAGNDRLVGLEGDDVLLGGADDDALYGGLGDDTLVGGSGEDSLYGSLGADVFVATEGANVAYDVALAEGDTIVFNSDIGGTFDAAFDSYLAGGTVTGSYSFDTVWHDGAQGLLVSASWGESLLLHDFDLG